METKKIYTAISNIMGKVGAIGKDKKNTVQNYSFRGIDDMYNALNKHLVEEGVFATSTVIDKQREERASKNGGMLIYTILTMKFDFFASDGSFVSSTTVGEAMDSGDKSANKAMSTAYKYALMQLFCIPTEEEKDTEYHSHEVAPKSSKQPLGDTNPSKTTKVLFSFYQTVLEAIKKTEDIDKLTELQGKIEQTEKLTDAEKKELNELIRPKLVPFEG